MGIVADDIVRVREASDFVAIAGEHVALKRVGRNHVGLCPFHAEKSASFSVNPEVGLYHCFGCGVGGDVISFVQEVEHLGFAEAVERLAARAGVQVRYDDAAVSAERQQRARLVEVMEKAVEWYHRRLLSSPDAAPARSYLRSRGYDGDVVRQYRIGWAPDSWDALCRFLDVDDDLLRKTGLGLRNSIGRRQDAFRARVMFPILDVRGDPVAFGGRSLDGSKPPKYKNSAETPLYAKSRVLYGLNWAKAEIVQTGEVVVCEGYTDVIGLARVGLRRAVATCGTALAEDHFRVLKNFARRVVLAYDADAAGQAAADRFYAWERRYEVDIAVARLPAGTDPGQLAVTDPERLADAVATAQPFLAFRIDRVLDRADVREPEGRARGANAAMAVVREHPDPLVRDQYVMVVADRLRLAPERLRELLERPAENAGSPERVVVRRAPARHGPEVEALRVAVLHPEAVADRVHEVLFVDPIVAAAFSALCEAPTLADAIELAGDEPGALLRRLAVEEADSDVDDVLARLAERAAGRVLADLDAASRQSADPIAFAGDVAWLKLAVEELRDPDRAAAAAARLVRWLVDRYEVEE
ncbi:MAG: DNA primase [Acidimicrobiales bacterium]